MWTVTPTTFIYTGGVEEGACVGLVNYPRFPVTDAELFITAQMLAAHLTGWLHQHSVLITAPDKTEWITRREGAP